MADPSVLFRANATAAAASIPTSASEAGRGASSGIIDIGSNSVRFVAYGGDPRVPAVLFNEKVMAGLGAGLDEVGMLGVEPMARALAALRRFRLLARDLGLRHVTTVATAAVRDAANGDAFLAEIAKLGFAPMLVTGPEEAKLAGLGVLSAIPDADGVAADLGGGSLELIRVADGTTGEGLSLPLGVLRLTPEQSEVGALRGDIVRGVSGTGMARAAAGRPLYLVGGSWRSLALIDLHVSGHPLPIVHQHRIDRLRVPELRAAILAADRQMLRCVPSLSGSRIPTLPAAAALLEALCLTLEPSELIVCAYGLREGLLFRDLTPEQRRADPLLAAARDIGGRYGRFDDHGDLIDRWIAPTFGDDAPAMRRLRLAACLLADIAWGAHPDFRAERAVDMAVHGNWVGIDAGGRAILGLALFSAFGGTRGFDDRIAALCSPVERSRAQQWGLAIRLAQRLSGGVADPLGATSLRRDASQLILVLPGESAALAGEAVIRRHRQLAGALGIEATLA